MLSAAGHIALLDEAIARAGTTVVLRRLVVDPDSGIEGVEREVEVPAHIRASDPQDLIGGDDVQDERVIISASSLGEFGVPIRDDRIEIRGRQCNVQQATPIDYGGELVRVNLLCRGGPVE